MNLPDQSERTTDLPRTNVRQFHRSAYVKPLQTYRCVIDSVSTNPEIERSALIQVLVTDENGIRLPIPNWPDTSAHVNEYVYLKDGDEQSPAITDFRVQIPPGGAKLELIGHHWRAKALTTILGEPVVHLVGSTPLPFQTATGANIPWRGQEFRYTCAIPEGASTVDAYLYTTAATKGNAPVAVKLLDSEGSELLPPEGLPTHASFATFTQATVDTFQSRSSFHIDIPDHARFLEIAGIMWADKTPTFDQAPRIQFETKDSLEIIKNFIQSNSDRPFVLIDTTAPPLGHETLALRPNNLALEYSRLGWAVLFVPFGSTQEYPWLINDHLAQVPREQLDDVVNYLLLASTIQERIYICSSFPSMENNARGERLRKHGWKYIYEIRDDMEEFNRVGYSKWYHPLLEARMVRTADLVVTVSDALSRKAATMTPQGNVAITVPNGVSESTLKQSTELRAPSALEKHNSGGIVGYVGHLTPSWFDWNTVIQTGLSLPNVKFEIVGHGAPDGLNLPDNIHYLGPKTHSELRDVVRSWKVGLIPFIDSPLTRGVDPNKIYEYFSWGLRVISARMGKVHEYPSTRVYSGVDDLTQAVIDMTSTPITEEELSSIAEFSEISSWRNRALEMMQIIDGVNK